MRRLLAILLVSALALLELSSAAFADDVYVRGYTRKDGTYVAPHHRSAPDGDTSNNWSTRGNVNPYTGQPGTRSPEGGSIFGAPASPPPSRSGAGTNLFGTPNTQGKSLFGN